MINFGLNSGLVNVVTFTSSGSYTRKDYVSFVIVYVVGAGGGGGGTTNGSAGGSTSFGTFPLSLSAGGGAGGVSSSGTGAGGQGGGATVATLGVKLFDSVGSSGTHKSGTLPGSGGSSIISGGGYGDSSTPFPGIYGAGGGGLTSAGGGGAGGAIVALVQNSDLSASTPVVVGVGGSPGAGQFTGQGGYGVVMIYEFSK
jgi:hypothetical protein